MKKYLNYIAILSGIFMVSSCDKEVTNPKLDDSQVVAPVLSAPANNGTYVFSPSNAKDSVKFVFTKAEFPLSVAEDYIVEAALSGTNFAKTIVVGSTTKSTAAFDIANFNKNLLTLLGDSPSFTATKFDFRISARLSDFSQKYSSNVISLTITPYDNSEVAFALWVPGNYEGWSPATAPKVYSPANDGVYQGYVNFTGTDIQFKFTGQPDWNPLNWGNGGVNALTGSLTAGADNIHIGDAAGYYQVNVDIPNLTYKLILTSWGIIGDATAGGWNTDTPMTYNTTTKLWSWTGTLAVGSMKFRSNNDWNYNYGGKAGDNDPANYPNGEAKAGGGNIKISSAGNYTITLDLSKQPYKYKIVAN
jgi:hypothetical protein